MTNYRIPMYKISMIRDGSVCAERTVVTRSQDLSPLLEEYFKGHDREEMLAVLLDAKHKIIGLPTPSASGPCPCTLCIPARPLRPPSSAARRPSSSPTTIPATTRSRAKRTAS